MKYIFLLSFLVFIMSNVQAQFPSSSSCTFDYIPKALNIGDTVYSQPVFSSASVFGYECIDIDKTGCFIYQELMAHQKIWKIKYDSLSRIKTIAISHKRGGNYKSKGEGLFAINYYANNNLKSYVNIDLIKGEGEQIMFDSINYSDCYRDKIPQEKYFCFRVDKKWFKLLKVDSEKISSMRRMARKRYIKKNDVQSFSIEEYR